MALVTSSVNVDAGKVSRVLYAEDMSSKSPSCLTRRRGEGSAQVYCANDPPVGANAGGSSSVDDLCLFDTSASSPALRFDAILFGNIPWGGEREI
jgi:hypothetical protein